MTFRRDPKGWFENSHAREPHWSEADRLPVRDKIIFGAGVVAVALFAWSMQPGHVLDRQFMKIVDTAYPSRPAAPPHVVSPSPTVRMPK